MLVFLSFVSNDRGGIAHSVVKFAIKVFPYEVFLFNSYMHTFFTHSNLELFVRPSWQVPVRAENSLNDQCLSVLKQKGTKKTNKQLYIL